jgi:hypothetical protein
MPNCIFLLLAMVFLLSILILTRLLQLPLLHRRKMYNIDRIRNHIALGGANDPSKFPYADIIFGFAPQIVCDANVRDGNGYPISLETYQFKPAEVFKNVHIDDYMYFLAYTLEYKAMILEQVSAETEENYLKQFNGHPPPTKGTFYCLSHHRYT